VKDGNPTIVRKYTKEPLTYTGRVSQVKEGDEKEQEKEKTKEKEHAKEGEEGGEARRELGELPSNVRVKVVEL
jgi:hypothetical protein